MKKIMVALTCFNRAEKTVRCVETLVEKNPELDFHFVIVDDNSSDDTVARLKNLKFSAKIEIIQTEGNVYYSGGMRIALDRILMNWSTSSNYVLLINDDVEFLDRAIEKMVKQEQQHPGIVIVGAICDETGKQSYGAVKYYDRKRLKARKLTIEESNTVADTFNANCVLVPMDAVRSIGGFDNVFIHSLGDYDYGLRLSADARKIYSTDEYVGVCSNNSQKGTWLDTTLTRGKRIRLKESIKGAPAYQWWYFTKKHFGYYAAIRSLITPYVRILLGK